METFLKSHELLRLEALDAELEQAKRAVSKLNAEKRAIRQRAYARAISRRDARNASLGAHV